MNAFVESITLINKAPFEKIKLDFKQNNVNVLTSINGKGKTTILSHIVDSWVEIARKYYKIDNSFYRTSSVLYNLNFQEPSISYIRYIINGKNFDFLEIYGDCTEDYYNQVDLSDKIAYSQIKTKLKSSKFVKKTTELPEEEFVKKLFENNVITNFPAYRYEEPSYLTDIYKIKTDFNKKMGITRELNNPLEVVTNSEGLANWILDVVLDKLQSNNNSMFTYGTLPSAEDTIFNNLSKILTIALSSKNQGDLKFAIGKRNNGGTRLQIHKLSNTLLYPSIFGMSSGEISIFSIFAEILKQADKIEKNLNFSSVSGVVLVDEIDKHLHIKLQREALPKLLKLFPNVQFILTSHSPFLNMGLADELSERTQVFDLDSNGIIAEARNSKVYEEVYEIFVTENSNFKRMLDDLKEKIPNNNIPLIITEGKTDIKHLKVAADKLNFKNIEFYEINEDWGDSKLRTMLENVCKVKNHRKIIGVFDRDDVSIVKEMEDARDYKKYSDEVYAFCIPIQNEHEFGNKISIEHYYPKNILIKKDANGRRLFLGSEFFESSNSKDGHYQTRTSKLKNKIDVNGIIDEKVYKKDDLEMKNSLALTKNDFSDLIADNNFNEDFDFSTFKPLFDRITEIINN